MHQLPTGHAGRPAADRLAPTRRPACRCRRPRSRPRARAPSPLRSPRFIAVSVHVSVARTHGSKASPLVASRPLGTSTLRTGTPDALSARDRTRLGIAWRASQPGAEDRVDDQRRHRATTPRPPRRPCVDDERRHRSASRDDVIVDDAVMRDSSASTTTRTVQPQVARWRAATSPSPPLLPCPATTTMSPARAAEVTPRAARNLPAGDLHELQRRDTAFERGGVEPGDLFRRQVAERLRAGPCSLMPSSTTTASPRLGPPTRHTRAPRAATSRWPALPISAAGPHRYRRTS